ncbi:MAG: xanthine dehydrogenase family protein molybdopterin-binding subunit [Alphaproteobacteria bacterium]|nr:xanthine dehydrogenase family protein molybdopterin-binding subunit [Alphaproteobacteria bacterium]
MSDRFRGRREDHRLLTGCGRYTADHSLPGQLHAAFRRADRAHALIRTIETRDAAHAPGVVAVLTGQDVADAGFKTLPPIAPPPGRGGTKPIMPERPYLARDRVRFAGEEVALVIAGSHAAAVDAAELIEIDYDDLPPVIGFDAALATGAPTVHDNIPGNLCFDFEYGDAARTAAALAAAARVVRLTVESPRVAPNPMEVRSVLAAYDAAASRYEIWCAHQGLPALRNQLAVMLGVAPETVRVNHTDVGGGFGARVSPFPEFALLLHVARRLGHPIKWLSSRSEDFLCDNHGRAIRVSGELGLDRDGRFVALRTEWLCDEGAYLIPSGAMTNCLNPRQMGAGPYRIGAVYGHHLLVVTNTAPTSAYRGAARPEAALIVERLVDEAAAQLGIDAFELRRRNVLAKEQMPYETPTGSIFDSGDFRALIDRAESASDWRGFVARRDAAARNGKLRGIGCAVFVEPSGGGAAPKDQIAIRFDRDGRANLYNVAGPSGQGHETVFAELVAAWLGLDPARVIVRVNDPDAPPLIGNAAIGSRSTLSQGGAFKLGAAEVIRKGLTLAAEALECAAADLEFRDGRYVVKGTDRAVTLAEIVDRHKGAAPHPLDTIAEQPAQRAFPSGAHVAEIEIDAETGAVAVLRYTAVDDVGVLINRVLAEGQIHGAVMQGAGQVFGERCIYDPTTGQLVTGSFMDYVMPHADLVGAFSIAEHSVPSPNNALGAKGIGEAGTIGSLPACMNAVLDALRRAGVTQFDMPATPGRIWEAIRKALGVRA